MFKGFKRKIAIMLSAILVAAAVPFTLLAEEAPAAGPPAFTQISLDNTSVAPSEGVGITVRTIGANHVFAIVDSEAVSATSRGTDSVTGETAWTLNVYPTSSQIVRIHANVTDTAQGAATVSIPVQVGGAPQAAAPTQATTPTAPPTVTSNQASTHRILNVEEIESTAAGAVTLRITTDPDVQYVWMTNPDDPSQVVGLANANDSGATTGGRVSQGEDSAVWEITYRLIPLNPHSIPIHVNRAYITDSNLRTETFPVELSHTVAATPRAASEGSGGSANDAAADGEGLITRVSSERNSVSHGESVALIIRTSPDVNYVWVTADDERVNATTRRAGSSTTAKVWNVDVSPKETQRIRVYANTTDSSEGAATDGINITVRELGDPKVNSITSDRTVIGFGESVLLSVTTNQDVSHVWANVGGERQEGRLDSGSSNSNQRRWELRVTPAAKGSNTIEVFGGTHDSRDMGKSDSGSITINAIE